jgi:hypothetical protein
LRLLSPPIDDTMRRKLVKVLALMSSEHDAEVLVAARQAVRLRRDLGCTRAELVVTA